MPSLLTVDNPVRQHDKIRIMEDLCSVFETDPMLPLVRKVLFFIPLEPNCHAAIIKRYSQLNVLATPANSASR